MRTRSNHNSLDIFRFLAALLVIAIHTSPLSSFTADGDFFLTRVVARMAVPFFFMVTGQFVMSEFLFSEEYRAEKPLSYLKKTALLYGFSILLYLPLGIYAGHYEDLSLSGILRMVIFDGTFYHLWYFPACILGILLLLGARLLFPFKPGSLFLICLLLYFVGLFGDSYYGLAAMLPAAEGFYSFLFQLFSQTRNGLFFAPVFLVLGAWFGGKNRSENSSAVYSASGFLLSFFCMTAEAFTLRFFSLQRHDSMYLFLLPVMFFLYRFLLQSNISTHSHEGLFSCIRPVTTWIYLLHPAIIVVVRGLAKASHATKLLIDNSGVHYIAVTLLSILAALFCHKCLRRLSFCVKPDLFKRRRAADSASPSDNYIPAKPPVAGSRAWLELDMDALENNVRFLHSRLPEGCRIMPVVKADAYGHGASLIAERLSLLGIHSFCTACASEGVALRKSGITGEILILGYTHPDQFPLLCRYHLTQTVVDYAYALTLSRYGRKIHVHIGIDTGMHRLGERCENTAQIRAIYQLPHLIVDGLFTHLAASDTQCLKDRIFTEKQAASFYRLLEKLKQDNLPCPSFHLLSSYGVLNYPEFSGSFARVGIALYGVLSTKKDTEAWSDVLCPVLSFKARVASVRTLYPGESAGYGMGFTAVSKKIIAALSVGYADGLPRILSCGQGFVLLHGQKAPIIGRICMDQTLIDVTDIPGVTAGETAVLIGRSGEEVISAADLAEQCGTITNEILSRLSPRLERIVL